MTGEATIFDPRTVEDVRTSLRRAEESECRCGDSPHENVFHDLVLTDIPWLLDRLEAAERREKALRDRVQELANRVRRNGGAARAIWIEATLVEPRP